MQRRQLYITPFIKCRYHLRREHHTRLCINHILRVNKILLLLMIVPAFVILPTVSPLRRDPFYDSGTLNDLLPLESSSTITLNDSALTFPGFIENRGQISDSDLYYYFMQETYIIGFYKSQIHVFARLSKNDPWENLTITFLGAIACVPHAITRLPTTSNYFNRIPAIVGVSHWAEIRYDSLYPGISLRFYADTKTIKYEFLISPGADPSKICLDMGNSSMINLNVTSNQVSCTSLSNPDLKLWTDFSPIAFQADSTTIPVQFQPTAALRKGYGFILGEYDHSMPLVIDPVILMWSTFLGGGSMDYGQDIAVDSNSCVYVTGITDSLNFPKINAFDTDIGYWRYSDRFVTKFAADGQSLIYSTYLGGETGEDGNGITVDAAGCVYITGSTTSENFPTLNAYSTSLNGYFDIFVTKLSSDGQSLVYSTFLGGSNSDEGFAICIDAIGCAYITGMTTSSDFPIVNAFNLTNNCGSGDVFITKLAPDGQSLLYSTYFGGQNADQGNDIAVDASRCAFIIGSTESTDFPTFNAYDATLNADSDAFVVKVATDGQSLVYSTFLGGSGEDIAYGIALDVEGCVYIAGQTTSSNFPTENAFDMTFNGGGTDAFVTKFTPDGQSLNYSTFLGGTSFDQGDGIALDAVGCIYISGITYSSDFPLVNAFDRVLSEEHEDVFVVKFATGGQSLNYSTYLGSTENYLKTSIAIDTWGCVFITGLANSADFPFFHAYDATYQPGNGGWDAFVTKLDLDNDGDTIADGWENQMGLNASDPDDADLDADSDGMSNLYEYQMGFNATDPDDADLDADNDGLSNLLEYQVNSDARNQDTDSDLIPDGWEYTWNLNATDPTDALLDKDGDGMPNLWEYQRGLNALDPSDAALDNDSDGLSNLTEFQIGTNMTNPDTDGDKLTDGWEYQYRPGLNPRNPSDVILDIDGDGLTNLMEFALNTSPLSNDTDEDGLPDDWEYQRGFNPTDPTDAALDFDMDGLSNVAEYLGGTDLYDRDSDDDGFRDGIDPHPLSFLVPTGLLIIGFFITSMISAAIIYIVRQHHILNRQSPTSMLSQVEQRLHNHNYVAAKDTLQRYLKIYQIKVFRVSPPPILLKLLQLISAFSRYYTTVKLIPQIPELPFITHETIIDGFLDQITTMMDTSTINLCTNHIQAVFTQLKRIRKDLVLSAHDMQEYRQLYSTLLSAASSEDPAQIIPPLSALLTQLTDFSQKLHECVEQYFPQCELLRMVATLRSELEGSIQKISHPPSNMK